MRVEAPKDVAMVLPLPVDRSRGENALKFIDLSKCLEFFNRMNEGFIQWANITNLSSSSIGDSLQPKLKVVEIGNFEASFVPNQRDFARLDPRFRLSEKAWEAVPALKDYGFAVFKLKKGRYDYHPMALSFDRADAEQLFFPTLHIHDTKVYLNATFDHVLYCQTGMKKFEMTGWQESEQPARMFTDGMSHEGIIASEEHCYRQKIRGNKPNKDIVLKTV